MPKSAVKSLVLHLLLLLMDINYFAIE